LRKIHVSVLFYGRLNALTGVSTVLRNLQIGFEESDVVDFDIFSMDTHENKPAVHQTSPVNKKVAIRAKVRKWFSKMNKHHFVFNWLYSIYAYDKNAKNVVKHKGKALLSADVLFFHDLFTPYYFRKYYKQIWQQKPKVVVIHNDGEPLKMFFEYFPFLKRNRFTRHRYTERVRIVLEEASSLIFLSEFALKNFIHRYPHFASKAFVVTNGIKNILLSPPSRHTQRLEQKIKIVTVGTVSKRKGHDLILEAFNKLTPVERRSFEINIVGDGPLLNTLKEKSSLYGINNVNFIGASREVDQFLKAADIFLLPSRNEGLPIAILEAMRLGLPIIGTNIGGIPDLVKPGHNGWLIEPTVTALSDTFRDILYGKPDLAILGMHSLQLFQSKYTIDKMINAYLNIFKKLL